VGVGQSETTVSQMVDLFVMLLQPGSGDDLQGIKRGILELVDMVIVTKDDGDQEKTIQKAKHDYNEALKILRHDGWIPSVISCSSLTKKGLPEIETTIEGFFKNQQKLILEKREKQGLDWMWQLIRDELQQEFQERVGEKNISEAEKAIRKKELTSVEASRKLLDIFLKS
jgi:LAO/AO transport system kinase